MEDLAGGYRRFGSKTLTMLILGKIFPAAVSLLLWILSFAVPGFFPEGYESISSTAELLLFFVFIFTLALAFAGGWLEYRNYAISFDENNFKVRRGALSIKETGIPYRHVREVKIERGLADQLAGVSNVIISKTQDEDDRIVPEEHDMILPAIDQATAAYIQDTILKKTEIEKLTIIPK